jgi:hypothetical protein
MAALTASELLFDSSLLSTPKQVKYILMESGVAITTDVIVEVKLEMFVLCNIIQIQLNAYNALLMAEKCPKQ